MKTSFGIVNNNIVEINDWRQLLNLKSSLNCISCRISAIDDGICNGTTIQIFNSVNGYIYLCFFVSGTTNGQINCSDLCVSTEQAVSMLNMFGYNIIFKSYPNITDETKQLLKSLFEVGYNYIYKSNNSFIFASVVTDSNQVYNDLNKFNIDASPNYRNCDFSFIEYNRIYSIKNLLDL